MTNPLGYHGLDIKDVRKDGTFLYIVRDPLEKIHSAFITTVYKNYLKPNYTNTTMKRHISSHVKKSKISI